MEAKTQPSQERKLSFLQFALEFSKASFLPMTEKQKEAYMQRIEEKRDFYQPKIEEKTGVSLERVYVLPNLLWQYQELCRLYQTCSNPIGNKKSSTFTGKITEQYIRAIASIVSLPIVGAFAIPFLLVGRNQEEIIDLAADENCIRVPFGMNTRQKLSAERRGVSLNLDEKVVHELSHILWDKLKTDKKTKPDELNARDWIEGFATYCHENYFADLYPTNYVTNPNLVGGIYKTGKRKVEKAIQTHGQEILLQIPNEWRNLEKELGDKK